MAYERHYMDDIDERERERRGMPPRDGFRERTAGARNDNGMDYDSEARRERPWDRGGRYETSGWPRRDWEEGGSYGEMSRGSGYREPGGSYGGRYPYDEDDSERRGEWRYGSREGRWESDRGPYYGRGPKDYKLSDDEVRERACEALACHGWIDASDVNVSVLDGDVTLSGSVPTRNERRMAEDSVASIFGVRDLNNQLRVGNTPGHRVERDVAEEASAV